MNEVKGWEFSDLTFLFSFNCDAHSKRNQRAVLPSIEMCRLDVQYFVLLFGLTFIFWSEKSHVGRTCGAIVMYNAVLLLCHLGISRVFFFLSLAFGSRSLRSLLLSLSGLVDVLEDLLLWRDAPVGLGLQPACHHFSLALDGDLAPLLGHIRCREQFLSSTRKNK